MTLQDLDSRLSFACNPLFDLSGGYQKVKNFVNNINLNYVD